MSVCPLSEACHRVYKEALLHYKSKIGSDPSKLLHSWLASSDCNHDWEGVACNYFNGTAVNLTLTSALTNKVTPSETYASGTLSPYLGNLSHLQVMDLSYLIRLHGPIPVELAKLSHMRKLFLYSNILTSGIPTRFIKLFKPEMLYLDNNHLSDDVPSSVFASMKSLTELDL
ncbi:Leucine-rich repeat-containing N-terminal, plant-type [Sesbania bispinosa]|nr:Leucine-rich repeat-containing N-terminal, plant-type [Sesbania bispinosa]